MPTVKIPSPSTFRVCLGASRGRAEMTKPHGTSLPRHYTRRGLLTTAARGAITAGALSAYGGIARISAAAAPTINIGGLYPVTGSLAQIGQGIVNAANLAVRMVNDGGGIKSLGGARLNLITS